MFSNWCPAGWRGDVGVELALIQEPELMAWDLFGTLFCSQSHVDEPVVVAALSFVKIIQMLRGSCFVMIRKCFELLTFIPFGVRHMLSVSLFV